jgi:PHD/YefM family antitoxin component YafN of YafNO toxin-antitoxin module
MCKQKEEQQMELMDEILSEENLKRIREWQEDVERGCNNR